MHISDHAGDLVRYKDWAPTRHDCRGLGLEDRQDWIVVPVLRTRDSGPLAESNFAVALATLEALDDTVETHRFGHWGPGWYEVILAPPSLANAVAEIACALADYPILDESDFSERESQALWECWEAFDRDAMRREVADAFELSDAAAECILDKDLDAWHATDGSGDYMDDGGSYRDFSYIARASRSTVAALIRRGRRAAK